VLLRQCEARRDPLICAEQLADEIRAVALLATMQKHNVVWQSVGAVEEFAYGCQGLAVGRWPWPPMIRRFRNEGLELSICI
jgi:hypothetical protein